jgi:aryl-alcohol dehydrogenase-like predicted oxidoreductase
MDPTTPNPDFYNVAPTDSFNGMPFRQVGSSGLRVPVIGLGTWKFGYPDTGDGARVDFRNAFAIFDRAVELGAVHWDTANRYNDASGNSERLIGQWLASNPDQRRNVLVATKLGGWMDGRTPNHGGLSRLNIIGSMQASLARLRLDYVDLLWFHDADATVAVEESLETVEDLVRAGVVRYFGVSNVTREQLRTYLTAAARLSHRCRPIAVQNRFDPLNGELPQFPGVLEFCAEHGVGYVPYSPLARGLLSKRYLDPTNVGRGDRLYDEGRLDGNEPAANLATVRRLAILADDWGIAVSQVALAYTLTLPGISAHIPSSSSVAQLESNAAAGRVVLTETQIASIRAVISNDSLAADGEPAGHEGAVR